MKDKIATLGIFSVTQTFYQIGTIMLMAVSVLSGQILAPSIEYASLPLSFSVLGTFLGLFPAAFCMKKIGRRNGLLVGTTLGIFGTILCAYGLYSFHFIYFVAGHLLYGFHQSFLQFLRFVAMESVSDAKRATALSWILLAGIPAAFLGPMAGLFGKNLIPTNTFLGCFLLLLIALSIQFLAISQIPHTKNHDLPEILSLKKSEAHSKTRSFSYHLRNPGLWSAIVASSFSFGLMVMLMSAVPIAMKSHGHEMHLSTLVLQWHVLGMYIPSFFSGLLVKKFGSPKLILAGILILLLEVFTALQGTNFLPFAGALVLLGVGWNFMYVGGTNLLVDQYLPSEKNTIQAINDSFVYLLATFSVYSSAYLHTKIGWFNLNLVALPFLFSAGILVSYYYFKRRSDDVKMRDTTIA